MRPSYFNQTASAIPGAVQWLPDSGAVEEIHFSLARIFEEEQDPISPVGVKSREMLESACARPHTGIGGHDKYKTLEEKLGALFHSLTKNHPFHNGNKRTAVVAVLTALHRNDRRLAADVTDDQLYDFVVSVTADEFPKQEHGLDVDGIVKEISRWLKRRSSSTTTTPVGMKTRQFIDRCTEAGAHCKNSSGGAYVISYKAQDKANKSVRISKSTRQLSGPVVRQYLKELGLNESAAGISFDEFQAGVNGDGEKAQIYRYIVALRRLAKT